MTDRLVQISKRIAYVLRHDPAAGGVQLDAAGWVPIDDLLTGLHASGVEATRDDLEQIVRALNTTRYEIDRDRIRATHGHSVRVDLGLVAATPPALLFHGTVARFLGDIFDAGLQPRERTHVHLSPDRARATSVARRRGTPIVLIVDATRMHRDGHEFWKADDAVWLVRSVSPGYLTLAKPVAEPES